MTRRAFGTRGNLADQLFRCLETPYSDVLEHNTVSPTQEVAVESRFRRDPRLALFLFSDDVAQRVAQRFSVVLLKVSQRRKINSELRCL